MGRLRRVDPVSLPRLDDPTVRGALTNLLIARGPRSADGQLDPNNFFKC